VYVNFLIRESRHTQIAEKAVYRSVLLTTWHCILSAELYWV